MAKKFPDREHLRGIEIGSQNVNGSLSFVCDQLDNLAGWNDFVAVFLKDEKYAVDFHDRIIENFSNFKNGRSDESDEIINFSKHTYDFKKLLLISQIANNQVRIS